MRISLWNHADPKKKYVAVAAAVVALAFAGAALAWSQTYASSTYFSPGGGRTSASNSSIDDNQISFVGSDGYGGTTLCTTQTVCYSTDFSNSGYIDDTRSISYGYAYCQASSANGGELYVYYCDTHN
jgi:hypothetical protein